MADLRVARLLRTSHQGRNEVAFTGRISGRALKPVRYLAMFSGGDAAARTTATVQFRIVNG